MYTVEANFSTSPATQLLYRNKHGNSNYAFGWENLNARLGDKWRRMENSDREADELLIAKPSAEAILDSEWIPRGGIRATS